MSVVRINGQHGFAGSNRLDSLAAFRGFTGFQGHEKSREWPLVTIEEGLLFRLEPGLQRHADVGAWHRIAQRAGVSRVASLSVFLEDGLDHNPRSDAARRSKAPPTKRLHPSQERFDDRLADPNEPLGLAAGAEVPCLQPLDQLGWIRLWKTTDLGKDETLAPVTTRSFQVVPAFLAEIEHVTSQQRLRGRNGDGAVRVRAVRTTPVRHHVSPPPVGGVGAKADNVTKLVDQCALLEIETRESWRHVLRDLLLAEVDDRETMAGGVPENEAVVRTLSDVTHEDHRPGVGKILGERGDLRGPGQQIALVGGQLPAYAVRRRTGTVRPMERGSRRVIGPEPPRRTPTVRRSHLDEMVEGRRPRRTASEPLDEKQHLIRFEDLPAEFPWRSMGPVGGKWRCRRCRAGQGTCLQEQAPSDAGEQQLEHLPVAWISFNAHDYGLGPSGHPARITEQG